MRRQEAFGDRVVVEHQPVAHDVGRQRHDVLVLHGTPRAWFGNGECIRVENAPTPPPIAVGRPRTEARRPTAEPQPEQLF